MYGDEEVGGVRRGDKEVGGGGRGDEGVGGGGHGDKEVGGGGHGRFKRSSNMVGMNQCLMGEINTHKTMYTCIQGG